MWGEARPRVKRRNFSFLGRLAAAAPSPGALTRATLSHAGERVLNAEANPLEYIAREFGAQPFAQRIDGPQRVH